MQGFLFLEDKILKYHHMVLEIVIVLWDQTTSLVSQTSCIRRANGIFDDTNF